MPRSRSVSPNTLKEIAKIKLEIHTLKKLLKRLLKKLPKKRVCHPEPVRVFANGVRDLLLPRLDEKADPSHRFAFQVNRVRDDMGRVIHWPFGAGTA